MKLFLDGHNYGFESKNLCRVFFPYEKVYEADDSEELTEDNEGTLNLSPPYVYTRIEIDDIGYAYTCECAYGDKLVKKHINADYYGELPLMQCLFLALCELTDYVPSWGMLTGIHPVKLLRQFEEKHGSEETARIFIEEYFVSQTKLALAQETLKQQRAYLSKLTEKSFSLYVGIPFCPSRCSYCSFVSQSVEQAEGLIDDYFELLLKEIEYTAELVKELKLELVSVYVGGGTPTTLSALQLKRLCKLITSSFNMSLCDEFTVEAGRPDTITEEKLKALKDCGVTRISINPQSMSNDVLEAIGRKHTAEQTVEAFYIAKEAGFSSINADLIAGLPKDTKESFRKSLEAVIELGATNVTVHSLAIKRSSFLLKDGEFDSHKNAELASYMMKHATEALYKNGFKPYYLYRQSRMAGNQENTGWALGSDICAYNIYTMDESSRIIACGAGAVTKLVSPHNTDLKRIFNFKYPHEYISRHEEILKRKDGIAEWETLQADI